MRERGRTPSRLAGGRSGRPWPAGERCPGSPPPPPPFPRACLCSWRAGARWCQGPVGKGLWAWDGGAQCGGSSGLAGGLASVVRHGAPAALFVPPQRGPPSPRWGCCAAGPMGRPRLPRLLCLGRWGRCGGPALASPRAGWGRGGLARLRLVARSRHYAGRHFLSDPGEENLGAPLGDGSRALSGREDGACCLSLRGPVSASGFRGRRPRGEGSTVLRRPCCSFA